MSHPDASDPVRQILASRKYAHLDPGLVTRVVNGCLDKGQGPRDAAQRARRMLHQLYGAFVDRGVYREIESLLEALDAGAGRTMDIRTQRVQCRRILARHTSTAERLPYLDDLYTAVRGFLGDETHRILDLGCGLNPFALPWMGLSADTAYCAVDVDTRLAGLTGRYLDLVGQAGQATTADLVGGQPPAGAWDGALLLKLVPTLERQAKGSSVRLIRSLAADRLVISYARSSLGGRRKGMDDQYAREHEKLAEACGLGCERLVFAAETVFLCAR